MGYSPFPIIPLAIIGLLFAAIGAGLSILKRPVKNKKSVLCGFAALGVFVAYGVYVVASAFLSAFDTGYGYTVGRENIAALKGALDLDQIFAQDGAVLEGVRHGWSGKQCHLYFHVKEGSPVTIPQALDTYISAHPELGSGNCLGITVKVAGHDDAATCEKVYFWWRMLY